MFISLFSIHVYTIVSLDIHFLSLFLFTQSSHWIFISFLYFCLHNRLTGYSSPFSIHVSYLYSCLHNHLIGCSSLFSIHVYTIVSLNIHFLSLFLFTQSSHWIFISF